MKYIRKVPPVDFLDITGIEAWLEAMEAKGLRYQKTGAFFVHFTPVEPRQVRWHAEPMGALSPNLMGEQTAYSVKRGWVYAGRFGHFHLYRNADPEAEEFHTDPVAQAYTLKKLLKRLTVGVAVCLPLFLGLIGLQIFAHFDSAFGPVMRFVKFSNLTVVLQLFLSFFLFFQLCIQTKNIWKLKKMLSVGIPMEHRKKPKYTAWPRHLFYALSYSISALALVMSIFSLTGGRWGAELDKAEKPYPFLSLQTLNPGLELVKEEFGYPGYEGPDRDNYVEYDWRFPADIYEIQQHATIGPEGERTYLWIHWYDLRLPFLAAPLAQDLMDYHCYELEYTPERFIIEDLEIEGFDRFTIVRDLDCGGQRLIVRAGNRVAYLWYQGPSDMAGYTNEILDLLEAEL